MALSLQICWFNRLLKWQQEEHKVHLFYKPFGALLKMHPSIHTHICKFDDIVWDLWNEAMSHSRLEEEGLKYK